MHPTDFTTFFKSRRTHTQGIYASGLAVTSTEADSMSNLGPYAKLFISKIFAKMALQAMETRSNSAIS
jgi:hypothetical protein